MSIKRYYSKKDTTLWEKEPLANTGLSPILEIHSIYNGVVGTKENARTIIYFDISSLTSDIINKNLPDPRINSSVTASLSLFNCKHGDEQTGNMNIDLFHLSEHWTEGTGLDNDKLSNSGNANYLYSSVGNLWSSSGGDFIIDSSSGTQYFENGEENLRIDITNSLINWLNGVSSHNGFILKLSEEQESKNNSLSATSFGYKKFYGRTTNTIYKPYIELSWDGSINDNRNIFKFDSSGCLFFYNIKNRSFIDLNNGTENFPGNVTISGLSSNGEYFTILSNLSANRFSKGIYKCLIDDIPISASVYSSFVDSWTITSSPTSVNTFVFSLSAENASDNTNNKKYNISIPGIKNKMYYNNVQNIRIVITEKPQSYLTPLTASTTSIRNVIATNGYYKIVDNKTELDIIDFQKLSYDKHGNYFNIDTSLLFPNNDYRVVLKLILENDIILIDDKQYTFTIT